MKLLLRTIFFPATAARIFCRTPHKSRRTNPQVLFYHRFIRAGLVGQRRWGLVCLVSLLASLGVQAQSSTTVCATNSIDLSTVISAPVGSALSFSRQPPAIAIAAGRFHSIALLADGTTWKWGQDDVNSYLYSSDPIIAIAAGESYSLGVLANGTVIGRGDNAYRQIEAPPSASPATAVAANVHHSIALRTDGTVVNWGGSGTVVPTSASPATAIAAGYDFGLALKPNGTVVAWGYNKYGQLDVPASASPAKAIAAGPDHALALRTDGQIVTWGNDYTVPASASPAIAIAAGYNHALSLKADGTVVAWGSPYYNYGNLSVPAAANPAVAIAAGGIHSLAINAKGSVVGWGDNSYGQAAGYDAEPLTSSVVSPTATQTYYYIARPSGGSPTYGSVTVVVNPTPPARLYVNANATGAGNGLNWTDAFTDLQQALNYLCAQNLTEIWVAQGTYKPTTGTDRTISFTMKNGVTIYGGFAGTETALNQRNPASFTTVLSGDIGSPDDPYDNSYHVINNPAGLTNSAVLDGFVITGSNANSNQDPGRNGGGMLNNGGGAGNVCSPLIRNCIFQNNVANYGGALYNDGSSGGTSSPSLINCLFLSNFSGLGGALYNNGNGGISSPRLMNCSFLNNTALNLGQAMSSTGDQGSSNPVLVNCVVWSNSSVGNGNGGARAFHNVSGAFITTSYSLLEASATGYNAGTGTLTTSTSPFVSATDARLNGCAPAINAGNNAAYTSVNGPATDLAGNARIFPSGGVIDMGAYEFQAAPPVNIPLPSVNTATAGEPFSQSFVASGGSSPYSYSLYSGNLPQGLNLAATGVLSGIPTQTGSFTLTVGARDATGCSGVSAPYVLTVVPASPIRYVKVGGSGLGSSWADASGDLQGQIDLGGAQQVWVAQGTYKPGGNANTNRSLSFVLKNGVAIYGGFAGTETTLDQRNPTSFTTVLSGDIGTAGNNADNAYHVLNNPADLTSSAVLDGFLITGGNANGSASPDDAGGGMRNNGNGAGNVCSPLIRNCIFQTNAAANVGGALYNAAYSSGTSSPSLINCLFLSNSASQGGALYNDGSIGGTSSPRLTNCSFLTNSASTSGGAMSSVGYQGNSRPVLVNCVVWNNGGASTFTNGPGAFITTSYSLFEPSVTGYNAGTGNLTTTNTPFVSATDARFNSCSPAINAGNNTAYIAASGPTTDLAGNARIFPSGGVIDMGAYEFQAAPTALPLIAPSVSTATVNLAFSQPFTATGSTSPYSYSLASGSLPPGLSLAITGVVSGTPTQIGSFTFTVKAADATGCSGVSAPYVLTVEPPSSIRYVRSGASGSGNSWADASGDLQSQINFDGTQQVWVAQGTYKPGGNANTNRSLSFVMKNGVTIYGGFAASGTPTLDQRNPTSFTTTLSGDIGTADNTADNAYHVLNNPAGLTSSAVLDGFLITGGNANGSASPDNAGGGMRNNGNGAGNVCSPLIRNCIFQTNAAANVGGALYNAAYSSGTSSPSLINCLFLSNSASQGGALYNDGSIGGTSSPRLTNCSFLTNSASTSGGAMSSVGNQGSSNPVLVNCVVWGNGGASTFYNVPGAFITTSYSMLEAGVTNYTDGGNNLTTSTSPFVSATDARLNGCSPAINAGNNTAYIAASGPTTDLVGNARIFPSGGVIDMGAYEFQAAAGIIITTPGVSTATVGVAFSQPFTAAAGTSPYSYSLASGSLPPGLSLAITGVVSGTPTQAGSFTLTVKATDATGCSGVSDPYSLTITEPAPTLPDLSPLVYARPTLVYGSSPFTVIVDVLELNGVASSGSFSVRLTRDQQLSLRFEPTLSSLNGQAVQNGVWRFSDSNPNYYDLTTSQPIAPGGRLSFGLSGSLVPGASTGRLTVSSTVVAGTVVESRLNNNIDADKVEYFQQ